jgi:spermidine synthase
MGATLPLFCRQYVVARNRISLSVGLLYGLNTFGAATGALVCGFYLIPSIGVNKSIWLGALLNMLVGLAVWCLRITATDSAESVGRTLGDRRDPDRAVGSGGNSFIITTYILFFLSGFVVLGNEILWTRYLSLLVRNTVYTYTLTLTVILTGIVLGSLVTSLFLDRVKRRAMLFGVIQILVGLTVLVLLMLPAEWWKEIIDTSDLATHVRIFVLVLLAPAILSGMSFPIAIRMVVDRPGFAGVGVGKMTAVNTFGGILGSLGVGFIVLPLFGSQICLMLTTGISLFIGFIALAVLERSVKPVIRIGLIAISVVAWLGIGFVTGTRIPQDILGLRYELVDFREGIGSNLSVVKKNFQHQLLIDRMWQGTNSKNHQIMAAHVPMLLHESPKKVLVIGLGTGQTASRFLMYDVQRLESVDIEAALLELVPKYFESEWMNDPRYKFIVEDGRNYLTHTNQRYDVISIEVGQVFRPGLASFYTADFYAVAKSKLDENGIVCQFVPTQFFGTEEFRSVIRTFLEVFGESSLWYNTSEFLLIGHKSKKAQVSIERLDMLSSDEVIGKDLRYAHWGGPDHWLNRREVFLASFLCGPDALARLTDGAGVYRDDPPKLEYLSAKKQQKSEGAIVELVKGYTEPVGVVLNGTLDDEELGQIESVRRQNLRDIVAARLQELSSSVGASPQAKQDGLKVLAEALRWNQNSVRVNMRMGNALVELGQAKRGVPYLEKARQIDPENPSAYYNMANAMYKLGRYDDAVQQIQKSLEFQSEPLPDAHNNLASFLQAQGKYDEAAKQYRLALEIDPGFTDAIFNLGRLLFQQGKLDAAAGYFLKYIEIKPDFAAAHYELAKILMVRKKYDEAERHYKKAVKAEPGNSDFHCQLGLAMKARGKIASALDHYRRALELNPNNAEAMNNLAWVYATGEDDKIRNGGEAVRLAQRACELTGNRQGAFVDTLSAAYAEAGRFDEAVKTAEKLLGWAESAGQKGLAEKINNRLRLYKAGKPYRERKKDSSKK